MSEQASLVLCGNCTAERALLSRAVDHISQVVDQILKLTADGMQQAARHGDDVLDVKRFDAQFGLFSCLQHRFCSLCAGGPARICCCDASLFGFAIALANALPLKVIVL